LSETMKIVLKTYEGRGKHVVIEMWMKRERPNLRRENLIFSFWTGDDSLIWWKKEQTYVEIALDHLSLRSRHPLRERILAAALKEC
jgi:hypothetical protein